MSTEGGALRVLCVAEVHSRPLARYLLEHCLDVYRGDRLCMAAVHPTHNMTSAQQQAQRRLLDNFADIASCG